MDDIMLSGPMSDVKDRSPGLPRNDPISDPIRMRLPNELANVEVTEDDHPSLAVSVSVVSLAFVGVVDLDVSVPDTFPDEDEGIIGDDGTVWDTDLVGRNALGGARWLESEIRRIICGGFSRG